MRLVWTGSSLGVRSLACKPWPGGGVSQHHGQHSMPMLYHSLPRLQIACSMCMHHFCLGGLVVNPPPCPADKHRSATVCVPSCQAACQTGAGEEGLGLLCAMHAVKLPPAVCTRPILTCEHLMQSLQVINGPHLCGRTPNPGRGLAVMWHFGLETVTTARSISLLPHPRKVQLMHRNQQSCRIICVTFACGGCL